MSPIKIVIKQSVVLLTALLLAPAAGMSFVFLCGQADVHGDIVYTLSANVYGIAWLVLFSLFTKNCKKIKLNQIKPTESFHFTAALRYCLILLGGTAVLSFLTDSVIAGVNALSGKEIFGTESVVSAFENVPLPLAVLCIVIIAPVAEELLFRKVLLENLLLLGKRKAVIANGILFGIMHFNAEQLLYTVFSGMVYALVVVRTGKIINAVCLHMVFNLSGGIILPALAEMITGS